MCLRACESKPNDGWSVLTCSPVDCEAGHGWTLTVSCISFSRSLPDSLFASIPEGQTCHVATALALSFFFCPPILCYSPLLSDIYSSGVAGPLMALKNWTDFY